MLKIEKAVIVEKTDTLADIVKEFCNNTNDAKELLKALFTEFPELESKPQQQIELLGELCYVSDCVDFAAEDFSPSKFLEAVENGDIYKHYITRILNNIDKPYSTEEHGNWSYAIPCNKIKIEINK